MYDLDRKMPVNNKLSFLLEEGAITIKICFAHLVFSAFCILCFLYKGYTGLVLIMLPFMACYGVALYLGKRKLYTFSKLWLIVLSHTMVYYYALQLGAGSGIQYAFLVLFFLPFLLFSPIQKWYIFSSLLLSLFVFFSFYYKVLDVKPIISIPEQKDLYPSVISFIYIMLGGYCFLAMNKSDKEESVLKQDVAKLDEEIKNIKFENKIKDTQIPAYKAEVISISGQQEESGKEIKVYNEKLLATTEQELINPILKMASAVDILTDNQSDKEQYEAIRIIKDKTYDIKIVLRDFSLYAKIKDKGLPLHSTEFSLQEAAMRMVQQCNSPEMRKKGVTVEAQFNPELPVLVKGNKELFEQILSRLVVDAIKRTEEGKIIIYILMEQPNVLEENPFVIFTVEDPGLYLPESKKELINLSFQKKGYGDIESYDELGLGLSIVKYMVDMQGGAISIENEGVKNKLTVRLPYEIIAKRMADAPLSDGKSPASLKFNTAPRFLIAEDNPVNQKMFGTLLTKWGGSVIVVNNGVQVIELLKDDSNFDLIIMDIHMDRMGGIECARIIRNELSDPIRNIPIIAVSAEIGTDKRDYYRQLGMNDYLPKPFTSINLFNTIVSNLPSKPAIFMANNAIVNKSYWAVYKNAGEPKQYVNLKNLQDLAEGDDAFIDEILTSIFDSVPYDLMQMKHDIETGNWEGVKQLSYKIKSSVILIGSQELEEKIYSIYVTAENPDEYSAIPYLYNQAVSLARLSLKEIDRFFNDDGIELMKGSILTQVPAQLIKKSMEAAKATSPQATAANVILPLKKRVPAKAKGAKSRLLLVEDNMAVMKILSNKLEKDGYQIDSAHDGKQAIDKLNNGSYDLVLTDLMLPFVNGLEIVNHIREKQKLDIPVIILTSVELEETVVEAFKIGVTDVLFKPFSPSELSARIKKYLQ